MDVGESIIIGNCWKLPGNAAKEGYDGLEEVGRGIVNGGKGDWSGKGSFSISAISSAAGNMHARNLEFRPTERITIHSTYYYDGILLAYKVMVLVSFTLAIKVIKGEGGSSLCGGQAEGSKTEIVWTCEETGRRRPSEEVRGVGCRGTRRGRGRPKKYWGEVIRQDLAQLHLIEDMTLDRKEWRSRIKVEDTKMETCEDERSSLKRRLSAASVEIEKQRMKCFP
ncbi:hypothetical protein H5410_001299 [Solanum commersonii]|uniref:Uncharacterized protein n=1 Tax=Solanum commersonii TaxID=4109 RepID=A0A9J6AYI7_SOLCO|nr:hypothetical protein H5410_001299 [Solanum commersonii]